MGLITGSGRSPGGGHGNLLQDSSLGYPTDRGALWAIVHGVTKSWTWLKWFSTFAKEGGLEHMGEAEPEQQKWCLWSWNPSHGSWACSPREPGRSLEWLFLVVNYETKDKRVISRIKWKEYRVGKLRQEAVAIFLLCGHGEGLLSWACSHFERMIRFWILWVEAKNWTAHCVWMMNTCVSTLSKG